MSQPTPSLELQACKQNLRDMKPVIGGRYCSACSKTITDLRDKSNAEILALIQKKGSLCGVIANDQIPISSKPAVPPKPNGRWRSHMLTLYSTLGLALALPQWGKAQTTSAPTETHLTDQSPDAPICDTNFDQSTADGITVQGTITDFNGVAVAYANVILQENRSYGVIADLDGHFVLTIPDSLQLDSIQLVASFIGCESDTITFNTDQREITWDVQLAESAHHLGGAIVIYRSRSSRFLHRAWWRIRHPFR